MTRFLIYLFPAIMDVVLGAVFFVTIDRMTAAKCSGLEVSFLTCSWALAYTVVSMLMGRFARRENAAGLLIVAALGITLVSALFMIFPGIYLQYLFIALTGMFAAMFFAPFQVFMRAVEDGKPAGVRRSTALYTFSWSFGMASGPFLSGFIISLYNWRGCHIMNLALGIVVAVGVWLLKHHAEQNPVELTGVDEVEAEHEASSREYAKMPDLAWVGWIVAGVGCLAVTIVRGLFQYRAEALGVSAMHQGNILALVSYSQAFTALFLGMMRYWMYRRLVPLALAVSGIAGLLIIGLSVSIPVLYAGALLFGFFSSSFFFYFVFHSLVHPERSSVYVSVNESVVGVTAIIAPVIGGLIADGAGRDMPFLAMVPLVAVAAIFQCIIHGGRKVKDALKERALVNG